MSDLFSADDIGAPYAIGARENAPLADRLRPTILADVVGQDHIVGAGGPLAHMIAAGQLGSIIFWGPPGVGKTTIARLLADAAGYKQDSLSAVFSGVADLRKAFDNAKVREKMGQKTLLFIDEIHRFNRAQQDSFLPLMEDGTIVLVGATTENPSFALNGALLSRARVMVLKPLDAPAFETLVKRAEAHMGRAIPVDEAGKALLMAWAGGDGRHFLGLVEDVFAADLGGQKIWDGEGLQQLLQRRAAHYDRAGDGHFDAISALHKSVRASDPDGALYWLARMLAAGEDPLYVARRLIRMASEDIGLADPTALRVTIAAREAYEVLGSPEGELALAQAVTHLACAPKSNAVYKAFGAAQALAASTGHLGPPMHFRNAPTKLMKSLGHGADYQYDPDVTGGVSGLSGFPDELGLPELYQPNEGGAEGRIVEKLAAWRALRVEKKRF